MGWIAPRVMPSKLVSAAVWVLFPITFALVAAILLHQERAAVGRAAALQADNLATSLQSDIGHAIDSIDSALNDVRLGLPIVQTQALSPEARQLILFDSAMRRSHYGVVLVVDERGKPMFDSRSAVPAPGDYAGRDWLAIHRDDPSAGLVVGLDSHSISETPTLTFSRGLRRADGSFGGVAVAVLQLSMFRQMFGSLHLGTDDDVLLFMTDGRGIYRRSTGAAVFGTDLSSNGLVAATRNAPSPAFTGVSAGSDGQLFAYRRLGGLPLAIVVALSSEGIYAAWWSEAWTVGGSVALLLVFASLLATRLRRELRRRERAEAEVRESELKFRLLADNSSDMISRVDASGERDYVSPASERLLGVTPDRLVGRALWDYLDPEDKLEISKHKDVLGGSFGLLNACFRVRRSDGEQRWVEAVARAMADPVTGAPRGYISAWRDITDRKRAEMLLGESEARYRALVDNARDIITSLDLDLRRTYVSPAARVVLGYEPELMLGLRPEELIHPDDQAEAGSHLNRLRSGETDHELLTCRLRHRSGSYVWIEGKLVLVRDPLSGAPASILCAIRDISERKAQEETLLAANLGLERLSRHLSKARDAAEQANDAKSRFLANISHELRTPLNGILGYTQLLRIEGDLNKRQAERVEAMIGAGQHLLEMINGVLDISEIEAGRFELRPVSTDLGHVAASCLDLVRPAAEGKALALSVELTRDLPRRIIVDPTRLRQILLNLLGNAVKYTRAGKIQLRARQVRHMRLRIDVADTGPGIAENRRAHLFKDFERLGAEATSAVEGAGVGLALSRRLAIAMGGTMGHEPNPAGGSVFWFELPLQADDRPEIVPPAAVPLPAGRPAERPAGSVQPGSLRVLVVDDVAINRDVTASFLRAAGHQPTCADNGEDAVLLAAGMALDLILIDIRMPGIGGLEATRRIRALTGPAGQIPVVALTAQAFAEEIAACRAAGMNAHLTKPFTQAALLAVLEDICHVSRRRAAETGAATAARAEPPGDDTDGLPVVDVGAFQQTAETLSAEKIAQHLRTLIGRTEAIHRALACQNDPQDTAADGPLASEAHAIAGSAGVFGFPYLAMVARNYEFAARYQPSELPQLTASLIAAAEASLVEMDKCAAMIGLPADHGAGLAPVS